MSTKDDPNADLIGYILKAHGLDALELPTEWVVKGTPTWSDGNYVTLKWGDMTTNRPAGLVRRHKQAHEDDGA